MDLLDTIRSHIFIYWKTLVIFLAPLILLPFLICDGSLESRTAYVLILMAVYWMTEALPLPVTSLFPIALLPVLGIMDTAAVSLCYMKETNIMLLGGLIIATSFEYCNLHRRIALRVLTFVGGGARWLILGFMVTTAGLSMWMSNTSATVMMLPIADAVLEELHKDREINSNEKDTSLTILQAEDHSLSNISEEKFCSNEPIRAKKEYENMRKCIFLSVAYAANLGGTGTVIGTGSNMILMGLLKEMYGNDTGLTFSSWMAFNIPGFLICLLISWLWLQFLFIGFNNRSEGAANKEIAVKLLLKKKYEELGPLTFHETSILVLFIVSNLLWFFRNPQFMSGWGQLFTATKVGDGTAIIFVAIFLFILPSRKPSCFRSSSDRHIDLTPSPPLLNWNYAKEKIPWGLILLLGAGFALSDASRISGLSKWLSQQLACLEVLPSFAIMIIVCTVMAAVTEVVQNAATSSIFLPILAQMAVSIRVNPIYLMLPAAVTCSYAFMLPVATPPNAIVFEAAKMKTVEMVKAGFVMNIICVTVICLLTASYGNVLFRLDEFPSWAEKI